MSLSGLRVEWRGVVLDSDQHQFNLAAFEGWESWSGASSSEARPGRHGTFDSPSLSGERVITLGGWVESPERDALLTELESAMWLSEPEAPTEPLTVTLMGRALTVDAHLDRFAADGEAGRWGDGDVDFAIQWRCPDPLRYGPTQNLTTTFPALVGGLEFDLFTDGAGADVGWLDFGVAGSSGRVTVDNPGTAPARPQFEVSGPTPPFEIVHVETGERLTFSRALSAGEVLLIDSATGLVALGGAAVDYSGYLTRAEWFSIPRKSSATIAFVPLGVADTGSLTVIHRPAWW